ncbi:hypothetical protein JCM6882_004333 [Rhodosporidiobolus microsporus]
MSTPSPVPTASTPQPRERHLIALKVLRSTRPSLVPQSLYDQPYEDGAGARAFRELNATHAGRGGGGMLKVPAEFGRIYLGETFSAVLSLSNDSPSPSPDSPFLAHAPVLKVEMHTALNPQTGQPTNKHLLATVSSADGLAPGSSSEAAVAHELKELGQHALVCTVQYGQEVEVEGGEKRVVSRSFRKVYKFDVASPLSVRTKAHSPPPTCASSSLSPSQRSLIFLEVQVHNHHASALFFERMRFEPLVLPPPAAEGAPPVPVSAGLRMAEGFADPNEGLFDGEADALLPPGGVRQFLYVLDQSEEERKKAAPGTNQGLGRLDIIWRTPHGEIGRLQSSTLGRRIPPLAAPPALALPTAAPGAAVGASPALPPLPPPSPAHPQTGPAPYRPSASRSSTPQPEPVVAPQSAAPVPSLRLPSADGLAFDFTVDDLGFDEAASIAVDRPFRLNFRLAVSALPPEAAAAASADAPPSPPPQGRKRRLRLAAQHVQHHPPALSTPSISFPSSAAHPAADARPTHASQPSAAFSLPGSFAQPGGVTTLEQQQQLAASAAHPLPRSSLESLSSATSTFSPTAPSFILATASAPPAPKLDGIRLPAPFPSPSGALPAVQPSPDVVRLGAGVVDLGWVDVGAEGEGEEKDVKGVIRHGMRFLSRGEGLKRVGGVRVLLLDVVEEVEAEKRAGEGEEGREGRGEKATRVVGEWDVVAEVWVGSGGEA